MKIFVTDKSGVEKEITDLYWFEEHGVHSFDQPGTFEEAYTFRFDPEIEVTYLPTAASCIASRDWVMSQYLGVITSDEVYPKEKVDGFEN